MGGAVADEEVVALAGHDEIVVAVEADLGRPPGEPRCQRRHGRPAAGLAFLAAEAAAHAPHRYLDGGVRQAENAGDDVLHLAGMLGGGVDEEGAVLLGDDQRGLALEIEMLLAADAHLTFEAVAARRNGSFRIAAAERIGRHQVGIGRKRLGHVDERGLLHHLDDREPRRPPRRVPALRHHGEERLAVEGDGVGGEERIVARHGADVVGAGNVGRRQHRDDAGHGAHGGEVERDQPAVGDAAQAEISVQQPLGRSDVVDIDGFARDMAGGGIVNARRSDDGGGFAFEPTARISHGPPPRVGRPRASRHRAASSRSGTAAAGSPRRSAGSRPRPACR
jgi:hypothetical protein